MIEIKRITSTIPNGVFSPVVINANSHHRCKGKWKENYWYSYYKRFPHTEKTIKKVE
jgi:hypothetical protein